MGRLAQAGRPTSLYTRSVHGHTEDSARLADQILAYAEDRFRLDPVPLVLSTTASPDGNPAASSNGETTDKV